MEKEATVCPVCTLYLREGITLQSHLDTHPKEKVIEALLKATSNGSSSQKEKSQSSVSSYCDTVMQTHPYVTPSTAFMAQTHQNYMNPTQMTAAVTYQQFVTSNGTVMPQYIQVPAIVSSSGNGSMVPNQTLNYVPNQQAYANTMYNPLYNPYIPQPYPFVQPMYGSITATSEVNAQATTSQVSSSSTPASSEVAVATSKSDSSLKNVSNVATNTACNKTLPAKHKIKKNLKTLTRTKQKIIRHSSKVASLKAFTSTTGAGVAGKPFRIASVNSKFNTTAKTAIITKARSIKIKYRPLLPKPSSLPPPPLMLMSKTPNSIECSDTVPPPPLSKAPCTSPVPFEVRVKSEKNNHDAEGLEVKHEIVDITCDDIVDNKEFILERREVTPVNSVIVESSSAIKFPSNYDAEESTQECESELVFPEVNTFENASKVNKGQLSKSNICEDVNEERDPLTEEQNQEYEYEDVFQEIEVQGSKLAFNYEMTKNMEKGQECDSKAGSIEDEEEDDGFTEENHCGKVEESGEIVETVVENSPPATNKANYVEVWTSSVMKPTNMSGEMRSVADLKSMTYTDLQPASSSSKVLQELDLSTSFDLNNYMEVDGIKIFFNNGSVPNVPLEPIIKFTSTLKTEVGKTNFREPEKEVRENNALVESVIHIVSGQTSKSDNTGEVFASGDANMDLRDLSPLTLNIRADESMPARGELSEQESLGAENSNWGLFHSGSNGVKRIEAAKEGGDPLAINSVIRSQQEIEKKFKCPYCPEIFSCMKARRVHKATVHENNRSSALRKPRTFACAQCKEKFTTLRDRRRHIIQNHYFDARRVKQIKEENEGREESGVKDEDIVKAGVGIKIEQDVAVKNESSEGNKKVCKVTKICSYCSVKVTGSNQLKEHLKEAHGVSRYKCDTCSEMFNAEKDYNSHLRIHPLECNQCGKLFSRTPNLKLHLLRHLVVKPYVCSQCPKSFVTRQKLDEHINSHSGNKPLKCTLCDRTFSRYSNLYQHRNKRHFFRKKDYVCRCGEVFHSMRKLEWHKEVHETKPKTCPFCSQKFIHSSSVTRHIRRSHIPDYLPTDKRNNENVQCPICGKVYLRSSLLVHMRAHNGEKPFVCKICNKNFTTKWNLSLHNWTHQLRNNMPFKCSLCKSAFFREVNYIAHMNSHKNHRPFTCNVCGQKFIRKYNCLRHQNEHKNEKSFVCTVSGCGKSFHRSYYLNDHMKVHTGIRPFTCHICGKATSTKSNHNKHVRIHDTREPLNTEN